jgi:hypothetical protein
MTLFAQQDDKRIKVNCTYGPTQFAVTEDVGHARSFWRELGALLDKVESEQSADANRQPA